MEYTSSQKKAIYTRNKSLLLSAAAGSGKTAVLVARILDIISDENLDVNIDDLLIVTFTNLAASQMKDRIYKAVSLMLKEKPDNKKLKKQLIYLPSAKIKTIHSFCLDIIKDNIDSLDIPVGFRIIEETEEKIIKNKVLDSFTDEMYKTGNEAFLDIINTFAYGRDDEPFYELILNSESFLETLQDRKKYMEMCIHNLEVSKNDFSKSIYSKIILKHIKNLLRYYIKKYDAAINESMLSPDFDIFTPFFQEERLFIQKLAESDDIFEIKKMASEYKFPARPSKKRGTDATFFANIRDTFKKKCIPVIIKTVNVEKSDEEEWQKENLIHLKNLFSLITDYHNRFEAEKRRRNVVTFSDFEHYAYKLLRNPDNTPTILANSIKDTYYEILIDEYQDTSDLQNSIFEIISKNGENLFMVGDVKQSIYKFRHAKPELFIEKAIKYEKENEKRELIKLNENFRSRHQILDSVNTIFKDIMTVETSMTDYTKEMLNKGLSLPQNESSCYKTEIMIFDGKNTDDEENCSNEGNMIAQKISSIIKSGFMVWDGKKGIHRPIEYSDIVILTRNMTESSKLIYNSLIENNIPVTGEFDAGFYQRPEIMIIMNILKAINNPYDELSLISMLKSPPFHFTETELLAIRMENSKLPFYDVLYESNAEKCRMASDFIAEFSNISEISDISEFVLKIYSRLRIYEYFSSYSSYENIAFNLDAFYETACEFEETSVGGLKGFIQFLETASKNPKKVKNIYESKNSNSVKMLTIHKSKGLEFPVVFVSSLGKSLVAKDTTARLAFHPEIGIGMDYISNEDMYINSTLCKNAIKISTHYESIMEELRILYVALTRAKEKLILTAQVSNSDTKEYTWEIIEKMGGHTMYSLFENPYFLDWIMPSAKKSSFFDIQFFDDINNQNEISASDIVSDVVCIDEAVFFQYPYEEKSKLPLKVTVSHANNLLKDDTPSKKMFNIIDLDDTDEAYSGSEYGTYFHKMFELCDIEKIKSGKSVKAIAEELVGNNLIEYTSCFDEVTNQIQEFFKTAIGKELLESENWEKEMNFLVRINANEIFECDIKDEILLQGAIDLWFEKDGVITLIDFKTDKNPDEKRIRENYSKQIELYAYALKKITSKNNIRKYIYTVRNSEFIEV